MNKSLFKNLEDLHRTVMVALSEIQVTTKENEQITGVLIRLLACHFTEEFTITPQSFWPSVTFHKDIKISKVL